MQRWEYYTFTQTRTHVSKPSWTTDWQPKIDLPKLGEEDWELVAVVPIADYQGAASGLTHQLHYTFKCPKGQ